MHALLRSIQHRPWPLPSGPWVMKQTWHDLLFAHWPLPPERLRPLIPPQLALDTFEGQCWIGVIPFWMSGIRARGVPPLPGLSRFPELNVRTYVRYGAKPGVYFFSLDAQNRPAVWAARKFFSLPYFYASMASKEEKGTVHYWSQRRTGSAEFRGSYRPISPVQDQGSLADFLTARYCLYAMRENRVFRCEIHHLPWPLQNAEAEIQQNTMTFAAGITPPDSSPILHFAKRLDVLIWPLRSADRSTPHV